MPVGRDIFDLLDFVINNGSDDMIFAVRFTLAAFAGEIRESPGQDKS